MQIKLLHDNSPEHKIKLVQECLFSENIQTLPPPPYPQILHHLIILSVSMFKEKLLRMQIQLPLTLGQSAVFQHLDHVPKCI